MQAECQKWAIELNEYEITVGSRQSIKGQIMADFLVEVDMATTVTTGKKSTTDAKPTGHDKETWTPPTDNASSKTGFGAGLVPRSLSRHYFTYALKFKFDASNNESEYDALLVGSHIAKMMEVKRIQVFTNSLLVASQIITRLGMPHTIITDNSTQFVGEPFKSWCERYGIYQAITLPYNSQANGQAEVANKEFVKGIKKQMEE
ncbi:reverse transcriptase domain-containing protein [Tanacetum coccineum]